MPLRWAVLAAVLALSAVLAPAATAQEDVELLQDVAGDGTLVLVGGQATGAGDRLPEADLVALRMLETAGTFRVTVQVAALEGDGTPLLGDVSHHVRFRHGDTPYQVVLTRTPVPGGAPTYSARLVDDHTEFNGRTIDDLAVTVDVAGATMTTEVARERLLDGRGAAPFPGRSLTDIHVLAATYPVFGFDPLDPNAEAAVRALDRMPEEGQPHADLPVRLGDQQSGDAALSSADPTRMSNGEATTYAFRILATNLGAEEADFTLRASGAPATWDVNFPVPILRIPAGAEQETTVLVSTPIGHKHGALESFTVLLEKEGDAASVGRVTLGVRYTEVAQPAGHHNQLYVHAGPPFGALGARDNFMNTLADDPNDADVAMEAMNGCQDGPTERWHAWSARLDPSLAMGLDFRVGATGSVHAVITPQRPHVGAVLSGELSHTETGALATIAPAPAQDLLPGESYTFDLEVTPVEGIDVVPYTKDEDLVLRLMMVSSPGQAPTVCPDIGLPLLEPGAWIRLPLEEYHDPLDLGGSGLFTQAILQRTAAAGSIVAFRPQLAPGAGDVRIELFGINDEWARLAGPASRPLTGSPQDLAVEVRVPEDAVHGDRMDLVVKATPADGQPSFIRLVLAIDETAPRLDETVADAGAAKQSPPASAALLVAGLAMSALALRRRRN